MTNYIVYAHLLRQIYALNGFFRHCSIGTLFYWNTVLNKLWNVVPFCYHALLISEVSKQLVVTSAGNNCAAKKKLRRDGFQKQIRS